jgi:hypothetical protein
MTLLILAFGTSSANSAEVRRLALVAGANHGRPERVTLRYAVADAERFAAVMERLGGVASADAVVLKEPTKERFAAALSEMQGRVAALRATGVRVEALLYYSGHADEQGLMLGSDAVSYQELRDAMQAMTADVGITVLDACGSGVITRLKGGRPRPAFLTDDSMRMEGQAFITSSSENEAAQESERLQGSFFTHALVSGLRGAADTSGDGKVTLGEAYQFAFQETLSQTTSTRGGAQHPAYDIRMSGTGDVVMTDVRQASAALSLGAEFDGRFFVRDVKGRLVAELYKPAGRRAEVALEPGTYEVEYEQDKHLFALRATLAEGERRTVERTELGAITRRPTRIRGLEAEGQTAPFALAGRTRFEISGLGGGVSSLGGSFVKLGLGAVHWIREDWALEASLSASTSGGGSDSVPTAETYSKTDRELGLFFAGRYYFPVGRRVRPFLRAGFGPLAVFKVEHSPDGSRRDYTEGRVSAWFGGGLDCQLGRTFAITGRAGWETRSGSGTDSTYVITIGLTFGRARSK